MLIKVQCHCGTRYSFDVEPVDGRMPIAVACPACGADGTEYANGLITQQAGPAAEPALRVRIHSTAAAVDAPAAPETTGPAATERCNKHKRNAAAAHCTVCQKPICTECMESFGYLCSVTCRYQAEAQHIRVPVCEFQKSTVRAREWNRVGRIAIGGLVAILALLGAWTWYAWSGSKPRTYYSMPLSPGDESVIAKLVGPNRMLLATGAKLTLRDLKSGKDIWSTSVADQRKPAEAAAPAFAGSAGAPPASRLRSFVEDMSGGRPEMFVNGQDVWLSLPSAISRFDLGTGQLKQTIPITGRAVSVLADDRALVVVSAPGPDERSLTRIDLQDGTARTELIKVPMPEMQVAPVTAAARVPPTGRALLDQELSGRLDEHLLEKSRTDFIPAGANLAMFDIKLLEANIVTVETMKAAPKTSTLNSQTGGRTDVRAVAEEIFNEIKRSSGGGVRKVNESRYEVTLRRLGAGNAAEWKTEVIGPPLFFPLKTVDVLVAGKSAHLLDKQNRKLAEAKLTYPVADQFTSRDRAAGAPCLEEGNALFLFDQGVLTAFDLPSGKVRWRLTSIGITGLRHDPRGVLYVSTTTATPESIQFSDEINLTDKVVPVLLKVDAASGKILWKSDRAGICHLSGKFVYTTRGQSGGFDMLNAMASSLGSPRETSMHFRIHRLNPSNGRTEWEFYNRGAPIDVDFFQNRILLRFADEIRVLKFLSL